MYDPPPGLDNLAVVDSRLVISVLAVFKLVLIVSKSVSYTHLTLPTILPV